MNLSGRRAPSGTLEGKVALISGSGRGIGRAVALKLASHGAKLVVNDLDEDAAAEVLGVVRARGGEGVACLGNVTAADFGERFVQSAIDCFGAVDIIVNNAGYTRDGMIHKQTDAQFEAMLDVHVTAPFRILRAASKPWREWAKREAADGREVIRKVVNISSLAGTAGNAGQVNYSAAKSAVIGMTRTLAKEWGQLKVCVNCVAFGFIETRLTRANDDPAASIEIDGQEIRTGVPPVMLDSLNERIPLGRPGTPAEAAGSVYFFCSPDSDYVSGEVLVVGGGLRI